MKKIILEFCRRGLMACSFGPMILAIFYLTMYQTGLETLTIPQVCLGIFSLSTLAFLAGGLNILYQIERLPLMIAILIHGSVLYLSYLVTYLLNGWLEWGKTPILIFTCIFLLTYLIIWVIIYVIIRRRTARLNQILRQKQQTTGSGLP